MKRVLLVVILILCASACRVRTEIGINVNDDGSGSVTVTIALDDDAIRTAPDFVDALKTSDLATHGWTVSAPVKGTDGFTVVSATKPFANADEANKIFAELSGAKGPFRDFTIARSRGFARTTSSFKGTVDFSGGLESFSDSDLAQQLDGQPLGDSIKAIEQRINDSLDNVFQIRISVRLPGQVTSNAPEQAANGARWQPRLSQPAPITLEATGKSTRWVSIVGAGVAGVSAFALVIVLPSVYLVRRRRSVTPPS